VNEIERTSDPTDGSNHVQPTEDHARPFGDDRVQHALLRPSFIMLMQQSRRGRRGQAITLKN
jgi:hypothetical protein